MLFNEEISKKIHRKAIGREMSEHKKRIEQVNLERNGECYSLTQDNTEK